MDSSILLLGVLFGAVGFGYFWYGRKQRAPLPLVCGLALMALPWFFSSAVLLALLGAGLCAIPWVWRS
ncbi:MAG: hypothetical protein J7507_06630 [Pseudoxanthomonas sp.]|nr:hypothetical protein [Pseudoxanthomonas sp.]